MSCAVELVGEKAKPEAEDHIFYHDNFESYQGRIFRVASFLRANFLTPDHWSPGKVLNAFIVSLVICGAVYSVFFSLKASLEDKHTPYEMASNLTTIAWSSQAIVAMVFIIYWQLYGHLKSYHRHIQNCQNGAGLAHGKEMINSNIWWFYSVLVAEVVGILLFDVKYYTETEHTDFVDKKSRMFYYKELRPLNTLIVLYTYIIWNVGMFLYITYTNTAFLEVRYFNIQMQELDGTAIDLEKELLKKIEVYGRLAGVIRELDRIFRLYAFIMVVIIVPSITFQLMMMNQQIHSWKDLILCLPGIALCAYSFLGVTVAPARLHEEVNRSKSCLLQNATVWFPYRKDVFTIATTLCQHMEQYDLGISIWGFAIVSRPLILATFSVMTMVLSLLIELSPSQTLLHHRNHTHMTEPRRLPRLFRRQVAIRVEDVDEKVQDGVEHYFKRLIWTNKLHGIFFASDAPPGVWVVNLVFNLVVLVIISFATFYEVDLVKTNVNSFDIEISTMLCSIVWTLQSVISMGFLIWWQISGSLWKYLERVIASQKGDGIAQGSHILKRTVCFAHFTNITVISIVLLVHYGPDAIRREINKYEIFTNILIKPLHTVSIIHVFSCWNTTVFLYNILIDGCYLEAKHFNRRVKKLTAHSDREYCRELVDLIAAHSRISFNVRQLDKMMKKYAFLMVATAIPCTLLTLYMLAQRVDDYEDFIILGLPSVGIILAAFLGITLAPARMYEELYRSKNYLCQNTNIWKPHREEVHKLAIVLSSHMEQPNLGLTIWGFAILSKPFILAIISVMIMVLSLVIEIVPTIKEFVEDFDEEEDLIAEILNKTSL